MVQKVQIYLIWYMVQ